MPNHLREIRRQQKLTGLGLAVQAGISTTTVTAIERWGYVPKNETQSRIAHALGVAPSDIWPIGETSQEVTNTR